MEQSNSNPINIKSSFITKVPKELKRTNIQLQNFKSYS